MIVTNNENKVLVLNRQNSAYASGRWCLPGGKVNYGETIAEAVQAELKEETGLRCTRSTFLFYQDSLPTAPGKMHGINLYFDCRVSGSVVLNDESCDYAWIGPSDLERYALVFLNDQALERYWGHANGGPA